MVQYLSNQDGDFCSVPSNWRTIFLGSIPKAEVCVYSEVHQDSSRLEGGGSEKVIDHIRTGASAPCQVSVS